MTHPDASLKRPTTIPELEACMEKYFSEAGWEHGSNFKPQPSDIIISPSAKCGTTWLQHITHGLRTRGSMDFEEINAVTPWLSVALDVGWDLDAPQVAQPRLFKSHRAWDETPKGARYIVSFRHYHDMMMSFYRFFEGWYFEPDTITLDELMRWRFPPDDESSYFQHLRSWWAQRDNPNILLLCYEDMKADLPATIRLIADFMRIDLDDNLFDIVLHQSSREFMLQHQDQFDEKHMRAIADKRAGLPPPISSAKVTSGAFDITRYQLSDEQKAYLDEQWRKYITPQFELETYDDLRQAVEALNQDKS